MANGLSYFTASVDLEQDPDILVGMSAEVEMVNQQVSGVVTLDTVSYTHLDVYKRQVISRTQCN